jgi:acyl carrier protein
MTRAEIESKVLAILEEKFEISNPDRGEDLRAKYNFDSIDAIDLLAAIEEYLGSPLAEDEKKRALEIRTCSDIFAYVADLASARALLTPPVMNGA